MVFAAKFQTSVSRANQQGTAVREEESTVMREEAKVIGNALDI